MDAMVLIHPHRRNGSLGQIASDEGLNMRAATGIHVHSEPHTGEDACETCSQPLQLALLWPYITKVCLSARSVPSARRKSPAH